MGEFRFRMSTTATALSRASSSRTTQTRIQVSSMLCVLLSNTVILASMLLKLTSEVKMSQNFGLIDQDYDTDASLPDSERNLTQWERFAHKLESMNQDAESHEYRLLYLGRHGQGYHNIGEDFYGTEAWNCYYSTFDSDPNSPSVHFFDAHLTGLGVQQAQNMSTFWSDLLTHHKTPTPQSFYVSPLSRAIETADLTFSFLKTTPSSQPASSPYKPVVKELLREGHGIHTCDRRPTQTYLHSMFPHLNFLDSDNFTNEDTLYSKDLREPPAAHTKRLQLLLDDIVRTDRSTFISMTSHSGSIAALLRAVQHREFKLPTGGAIPVLIKIEIVRDGEDPSAGFDIHDKTGWETKPECVDDPLKAGRRGYKNIGEYVRETERKALGAT